MPVSKERGLYPLSFPDRPGFDNLLVAGRCFSADQVASASVRVQASVMGLGQAAGCAAAQCACAGTSVHKADVHTLQAMLRNYLNV